MARTTTHVPSWLAFGLIAGGGLGTVLFALTGTVMWIAVMPGVGLLLGLLLGSWRDHLSSDQVGPGG